MKLGRIKQPPGGWHFPVAAGVRLTAINEAALIEQIHEYRLRNNLPPGDIERDIDEYYCTNWPSACQKESRDYGPALSGPRDAPREPLVNRVTRWVTTLINRQPRGGYPLVGGPEVSRRAVICAGCPGNKAWKTGCPGCTNNVSVLLLQVRALRKTNHDGQLFACNFGGWANETAVHLPMDQMELTDAQKAEMPARCWRLAA